MWNEGYVSKWYVDRWCEHRPSLLPHSPIDILVLFETLRTQYDLSKRGEPQTNMTFQFPKPWWKLGRVVLKQRLRAIDR